MTERYDLGNNAWLTYQKDWLSNEDADALFALLREEHIWEERAIFAFGKKVMQPRLMNWGGELPYKYSGQTLPPRETHPALIILNDRLEKECDAIFNHIILNLYRDGQDRVAMHADNEPELGQYPLIASLSLGAERRLVVHSKRNRRKKRAIKMAHGSLVIMGGSMQRTWRHGVPKQPEVTEERINVTFRQLMGPPGWRDPRWGKAKSPKPAEDKVEDEGTILDTPNKNESQDPS